MISRRTIGLYAAPGFALALLAITFYVYIPKFYADVLRMPLGTLSLIILLSRVWDALTDPLIGSLSDRTRSRFGRRRPWIFLATIPLAVCFLSLLSPPAALDSNGTTIWMTSFTFLFFLAWTCVAIPYEALGAELTFEARPRNLLLGAREGAVVLGTLFAALIPAGLEKFQLGMNARSRMELLGTLYSALLVVIVLFALKYLPERQWSAGRRQGGNLLKSFLSLRRNRPFMILLGAYVTSGLGAALPATLIFFFVEHVLGSTNGSLYLVLYFGAGFLCLPFWVQLASRWEKRESWMLAMAVNTGAFCGVLGLGHGDESAFAALVALSAVGYGATLAIPASMQADVIDFDEALTGKRREGEYVGVWSIAKKLSAALGAGLALWALDRVGYRPGEAQNADVQLALKYLYAGVPSLCNLFAMLIAWRYPITKALQAETRQRIDSNR